MTSVVGTVIETLTALPEYGTALRRLICELAVAGQLFPRGGNWTERRLDEIVSVRGGSTPSMARSEFWGGDIPWVSPKDMHAGDIVASEMFITHQALAETNLELVPLGSVLIVGRSGILKRKLPAQVTRVPCTVNQDIKALTPSAAIDSAYLRLWLLGSERAILAEDVKTGTTVQSLVFAKLFSRRVPLPPIAEQRRIVAKVDELMALCDRLEARQQDAEAAHARLVQALLDSLTQARNADELQACWQRLAGQFGTVFTTDASVNALKQAVVDCAASGRLRLANAATDWCEGRLGDWVAESGSGWSPSCEARPRAEGEWGVLKVSAVSWGSFRPDENKALPASLAPRPEFEVRAGDFLISRANTSDLVARSVVVEAAPPRLMLSDKIVRLRFSKDCEPRFAQLANSSTAARRYYAEVAGGTSSSMKNVTRAQILSLPIQLPGLADQHRIVAQVTELLALCDKLKTRIAAARAKHAQLAEALVAQAVAA
jgi:type I restriction enzyme S subunit